MDKDFAKKLDLILEFPTRPDTNPHSYIIQILSSWILVHSTDTTSSESPHCPLSKFTASNYIEMTTITATIYELKYEREELL